MARDTGWGYRRILGELKKLRIKISRSTVARVLRENGFDPGPKRGEGTWHLDQMMWSAANGSVGY